MNILTRCVRLRRIIRLVVSRIPEPDRRLVVKMVRWIRSDREWQAVGISTLPSRASSRLVPLISLSDKDRRSGAGQSAINFHLPVCRLFSDEALAGIVAHELAHALRAAKIGDGWYERMDRRWRAEEREADTIAAGWGFGQGIRAMREEHKMCVESLIDRREPEISRQMQRLWQRRGRQSRKRFEALQRETAQT